MYRKIDNIIYDTKYSKELGEKIFKKNGKWISTQTLYITQNEDFFIAEIYDDNDCDAPTDKIRPINESEANKLLEEGISPYKIIEL